MNHSPPPGTPRARIPGPRQPWPTHPRIRAGLRKLCLWGALALVALTALVAYATRAIALLPVTP